MSRVQYKRTVKAWLRPQDRLLCEAAVNPGGIQLCLMDCNVQDDVSLQQQWAVNGVHYSRTLEAWLQKQDSQRKEVLSIMEVRLSHEAWCLSGSHEYVHDPLR